MGERTGKVERPSSYQMKRAAVQAGEREPFQFRESTSEAGEREFVVEGVDSKEGHERVCALIISIREDKGCLFLRTEDGRQVYMKIKLMKQAFGDDWSRGFKVDCEINLVELKDRPRVTRVFSLSPPTTK